MTQNPPSLEFEGPRHRKHVSGGNDVFSINLFMKKMSFFETFLVPKLIFLWHKMSSSQISKRCRFLSPHIIVLLFFNKLKDVLKLKVPFPKQKNRAHLSYPFEVLKKVQTKLLTLILKSWRESSDSYLKFSLDQSVTFFKYRGLFLWKKVTILKKNTHNNNCISKK